MRALLRRWRLRGTETWVLRHVELWLTEPRVYSGWVRVR